MTIVIDVGCARYGGDYSVERLLEEFHPVVLYGFDPAWKADMFDPPADLQAIVHISTEAAWTYDGTVRFRVAGLGGQVTTNGPEVPCVDLARIIEEVSGFDYRGPDPNDMDGERWDEQDVILKMDAEGSEYELLEHLMAKGVDEMLKLAWIEWHPFGVPDTSERRASIERRIRCELTEWRW